MLNGQGALAMTGKIEFKNGLPFAAAGSGFALWVSDVPGLAAALPEK